MRKLLVVVLIGAVIGAAALAGSTVVGMQGELDDARDEIGELRDARTVDDRGYAAQLRAVSVLSARIDDLEGQLDSDEILREVEDLEREVSAASGNHLDLEDRLRSVERCLDALATEMGGQSLSGYSSRTWCQF